MKPTYEAYLRDTYEAYLRDTYEASLKPTLETPLVLSGGLWCSLVASGVALVVSPHLEAAIQLACTTVVFMQQL